VSAGSVATPRSAPRSVRRGHLSIGRILLVAALVIVVLLAGAVTIVLIRTPAAKKADCGAGEQCGNPPPGQPLVNRQLWSSSGLGYHFEYDSSLWELGDEDAGGVTLQVPRGGVAAIFSGAKTSDEDPAAAFDEAVGDLSGQLALAADPDPDHAIEGAKVGDFHADASGVFQGSTNPGQGRVLQVRVIIMSATDGETTITVTLVSPDNNLAPASQDVDGMLNTLRFPSEQDV
jgi:FlaG/FlaF family flagellin (archaellin)